ncbi:hypothetical protein [Chloroflexus sp.]|uniref:hypothetical protein n=1 Tax=Chloroflexus sp. TaxID=1904827 RepID=UPI0026028292|nr:hypothetical protein [uncultured Chloroflexus sp.]
MDSTARQQIARELCQRLATTRTDVVVAGMLAPSAPLTDFEPLELLVVVANTVTRTRRSFLMQDVVVTVHSIARAELESVLRAPDLRWPQWLHWLATLQPLIGQPEQVNRWLAEASAVAEQDFHRRILAHLPDLVFACYGELRAAAARLSDRDALLLVPVLLTEMHTALCLINRRWPTQRGFAGLEESFAFPLQPRDWPQLATDLLGAHHLADIARLAGALVSQYWQLLARCSLTIEHHQTIATTPL